MEQLIQLNSGAKLSPHFTLGEMTVTNQKGVYNVPTHEAIANLKRLCGWLEILRERYNAKYSSSGAFVMHQQPNGGICNAVGIANPHITSSCISNAAEHGIHINSGYRSPQLNKKIGGAANSNHLSGCAADIRVSGAEQAIRYAAILLDYSLESHQDFDELLIEKNRYGAMWLHFAVRPDKNRRKVLFLSV